MMMFSCRRFSCRASDAGCPRISLAESLLASGPSAMRQFCGRKWRSAFGLVLLIAGCSSLTDAETELVEVDDLANAAGALALRAGAFRAFAVALAEPFSSSVVGGTGLFTDELTYTDPLGGDDLDSRAVTDQSAATGGPSLGNLQAAFVSTEEAIGAIRQFAPEPITRIGDLFALRGYMLLLLAENFCSGIPLVSFAGGMLDPGSSQTTIQLVEAAVEAFDSATAVAGDSDQLMHWAAVGRGRALLNVGSFQLAAAAVRAVPTDFRREITFGNGVNNNVMMLAHFTISDREGGNGLPFVSAQDPRVAAVAAGEYAGEVAWRAKYLAPDWPIVLADGVEARLIEAEAELQAGNVAEWLSSHNALRASVGLDPLTDPGVAGARVDLHFSERAFWLFLTGHRLGDLRRLIRQYGRDPESVFPTGLYKGGPESYGTATSFPPAVAELANPNFTGCLPKS